MAATRDVLTIWTIYDHPRDFPHNFVAREWSIPEGHEAIPSDSVLLAEDIETLRDTMRDFGLYCLPRDQGDEPSLVETWV